jgi:NAD(P)-dependent dehydrogenase (short-subunit alcohol dehydrogenase family)
MKLKDRIALITGGGRGIGRAIALTFAREGAQVAVAARTIDQVEQVAREITDQFSTNALPIVCDVSDVKSVAVMFARVSESLGRGPDILVNNAGIAESAVIIKTDDELWHRHLAVNLSGTFYCTRAALPAMIRRSWGRIVNIASIAGKTGGALHFRLRSIKTRRLGIDALGSAGSSPKRSYGQRHLSRLRGHGDDQGGRRNHNAQDRSV